MLARMLAMDSIETGQLNSNKIEKKSEDFISTLNDEQLCNELFQRVVAVLVQSKLDISKRQFKAESETETLIKTLSPRLTNR
jgi:hypothetical protein